MSQNNNACQVCGEVYGHKSYCWATQGVQSGTASSNEGTAKCQKAVSEDAAITDERILEIWDSVEWESWDKPGRNDVINFSRSLIAAIREEVPTAEPRIEEGRFGLVPLPRNLNGNTQHLVLSFAMALAAKLHAAEKKYGYSDGWQDPDWMDECRAKLLEHVAKGDPRDVAAYCAFLWFHNESTAPIAVTAVPAGYKIVPIVATNAMMNASVNAWHAWHSWKSRNNGGSIQELGSLVYEHMIDAAPEVPKTQLGNLDKPQNSQQTRGEGE